MSFYDNLQAEAKSLGFDLVGITTLDTPVSYPIFQNWIHSGLNASMHYLSSERALNIRAHPENILDGAKSVILLGMRYTPPQYNLIDEGKRGLAGNVASYAWGIDYHVIIPQLLEKLYTWIKQNSSKSYQKILWQGYTDTGPVLERDLALRSGLGFIGKNSTLINHHLGSYFFLAEMFLTLELPTMQVEFIDRCGNCTRCIDACPTKCILPNRTIDAGRCISYLTIENKAEIPHNLRSNIGKWVFGCDICQIVCPWNKRLFEGKNSFVIPTDYHPSPNIARPTLNEDLFLSPREFAEKYKNSPIKRARRSGYLRNIAVVLGNLKLPELDSLLIKSLNEEVDPLVRGHVAWALANCGTQKAHFVLDKSLSKETDPYVRYEMLKALEEL